MKFISAENSYDLRRFAQCGSDLALYYGEAFPATISSEVNLWDSNSNFFFSQGGKATAILAIEGGNVVGRIGAFIHPHLQETHPGLGLLGMFESVESASVAEGLLNKGCEVLKSWGCSNVVGPVDFSIWHRYRFMTKGFGSYILMGEPRNPEWYPLLWQQYGFDVNSHWATYTYDKKRIKKVPEPLEEHLQLFHSLGYKSLSHSGIDDKTLLQQVYKLLMPSYRTFPLYTPLSNGQFCSHYSFMGALINKKLSFFIKNQHDEIVGFCLIYNDFNKALLARGINEGLIGKLKFLLNRNAEEVAIIAQGGTTPQHVREAASLGRSLAGAPLSLGKTGLALALSNSFKQKKFSGYAVTLVRDEAMLRKNIPQNTREIREYSLFSINI